MKLSQKILTLGSFIIILLGSLSLITPLYFYYPLFLSILLSSACFLVIFVFMQISIISPIKKLNENIKIIIKNHCKGKLVSKSSDEPKDNDEISDIARHINCILAQLKASEEHLTKDHLTIVKLKQQCTSLKTNKAIKTNLIPGQRNPLNKLAHYDELTALPNRIFFNEILNKTISHALRHKKMCAILLVAINSFDNININFGRQIADNVLKEISVRLSAALRSEDILAKLESDEFLILLNDIGQAKFTSTVAEKLIFACETPIIINSNKLTVTLSIGICIYPTDGTSLEQLLKHVYLATNKAKLIVGNSYQFYSESIDTEARSFRQLDKALKMAIENNELSLNYQPKLNIKSGHITGVEALIRWIHPTFGHIAPATFIPLAEQTGVMMTIGEWALREACHMNKHWQEEGFGHMTVSINLSIKQFYHPDMVKMILSALQTTKLDPSYLEIEINESSIMENLEEAASILHRIKAIGARISIDHFGTGYTSIYYLKKLPINIIKLDKSFIKGIPLNPDDNAITKAIISLAHHLGLEMVAEGVETAEQVQFLSENNCDMVQGYYLSHPLPAKKIEKQFIKLSEEVLV